MEIKRSRYVYKRNQPRPAAKTRWLPLLLVFVCAGALVAYVTVALTKPLPQITLSQQETIIKPAPQVSLPWPASGQAAIGSLEDGVLALSTTSEQAKPIASMAKIITALVLLQASPLALNEEGKTFTITAEDVVIYNDYVKKSGSVLPVKVGDVMTEKQALQALLIGSANNIADSLVIKTFGSLDAYASYANTFVASKNITQTTIADASGYSPQTISTPSNMIELGRLALNHPVIADIVATKNVDLGTFGKLDNTNKLLADSGVRGIKTGNTDEAGSCLLFATDYEVTTSYKVTIVGVVMDAETSTQAAAVSRQLLAAAQGQFETVTLATKGTVVGKAESVWGQTSPLILADDVSVTIWKGTAIETSLQLGTTTDTLVSGQEVGSFEVLDSRTPKVAVISEQAISKPPLLWRLRNL
jgi:D-alanyl-D-alanine carboxypeptidase (penicillin-binding protein 5/6)